MRMTPRPLAALVCAALASVVLDASQAVPPLVNLESILDRAGTYVARFMLEFANVVAEEHYEQRASGRQTFSGTGGRAGVVMGGGAQRRELVSDFLLVKLTDPDTWVPFRDVFQVDGKPVREREERLAKLLLHPTSQTMEQANAIITESARYNIGDVQRTINMPLLALGFLEPRQQHRFRFSVGKEDGATGVWVVSYQEYVRPTLVHSPDGRNLFANGRVWIEAATGLVTKTEMTFQDGSLRASVTTSFRPDDRFHLAVPVEMGEEYMQSTRSRVSGHASYGRFRRFDVTATETTPVLTAGQWMTEPSTGMVLIELPPGAFAMGSTPSEVGRKPDEPIHDVSLGAAFYLGRFEVTQQEWRAVMGTAPSRFSDCGPRCPVESVSFDDAQKFLAKLNARSAAAVRFRLPTEAEWEYGCRAGTASPFSTGATITTAQANYDGRRAPGASPADAFRGRPTAAGTLDPNPWGLADMHGNVAEWTADWYAPYLEGMAIDPRGPSAGNTRIVRGGSWGAGADSSRCASRSSAAPDHREAGIGFRVAADVTHR